MEVSREDPLLAFTPVCACLIIACDLAQSVSRLKDFWLGEALDPVWKSLAPHELAAVIAARDKARARLQ